MDITKASEISDEEKHNDAQSQYTNTMMHKVSTHIPKTRLWSPVLYINMVSVHHGQTSLFCPSQALKCLLKCANQWYSSKQTQRWTKMLKSTLWLLAILLYILSSKRKLCPAWVLSLWKQPRTSGYTGSHRFFGTARSRVNSANMAFLQRRNPFPNNLENLSVPLLFVQESFSELALWYQLCIYTRKSEPLHLWRAISHWYPPKTSFFFLHELAEIGILTAWCKEVKAQRVLFMYNVKLQLWKTWCIRGGHQWQLVLKQITTFVTTDIMFPKCEGGKLLGTQFPEITLMVFLSCQFRPTIHKKEERNVTFKCFCPYSKCKGLTTTRKPQSHFSFWVIIVCHFLRAFCGLGLWWATQMSFQFWIPMHKSFWVTVFT